MERHRGRTERKRLRGGGRAVERQENYGENKVIWVVGAVYYLNIN